MSEGATVPVYVCPMHPAVRQPRPGKCPTCRMDLVLDGAGFAFLRHVIGNPLHIMLMIALMVVLMAVAMVMLR